MPKVEDSPRRPSDMVGDCLESLEKLKAVLHETKSHLRQGTAVVSQVGNTASQCVVTNAVPERSKSAESSNVERPSAPVPTSSDIVTDQSKVASVSKTAKSGKKQRKTSEPGNADAEGGKSKAQLRKERREVQEAQRAAKTAGKPQPVKKEEGIEKPKQQTEKPNKTVKQTKTHPQQASEATATNEVRLAPPPSAIREVVVSKSVAPPRVPDALRHDSAEVEKRISKKLASQGVPQRASTLKKVPLFAHLAQLDSSQPCTHGLPVAKASVPPVVVQLGLRLANGVIMGSNARALALIQTLKYLIRDYETPSQKELSRDFEAYLRPSLSFLGQCRPLSVSMRNTIRFLKAKLTQIPPTTPEPEAKAGLLRELDEYAQVKIVRATESITDFALQKLSSDEVIMTFGWSSLVAAILKQARANGKRFRVTVVDADPHREGKALLRVLAKEEIPTTYILLPALQHVLSGVSKVILGAHALLANGAVMSRAGSSQVASAAREHGVPVIVACETYKFWERVQTDSIVFNELGDPGLVGAGDTPNLSALHLLFDVTPGDLISAVITEMGMLPTSSVPVVLRVKYHEYA